MALKEDLAPKRLGYYLIILAIAFVFAVQWGPGSRGCDSSLSPTDTSSAARVNGRPVPLREYNLAYTNQLREYAEQMRRFGQEMTEARARQMGLPQRVLDDMVSSELMAQEAERQGIVAPDAEVRKFLLESPMFQGEGGKFDRARYREVIRNYFRKTEQEYESDLRRRLGIQKLYQVVGESAQVSDDEVRTQYFREGDRAKVTHVRFEPTMFAGKVPAPRPAELEAYRKSHEKEIAADYEANAYVYKQPEKVRARHILVAVKRDATQEQKDAARAKVDGLKKQLDGGKDFAELAKEASDDEGSKGLGGDLGLQPRESWVPEFSATAFALKPGEVSAPVESLFGLHLIKVEEKKPAETKSLESVAGETARKLWTRERSQALAKAEAEKALAAARGGKKLEDMFPASKSVQFEVPTTPEAKATPEFAVTGESIPQLPPMPDLMKDVAAAKGAALLDKLYPSGDGWLVARVDSRAVPSDETFVRDLPKLRQTALQAKQGQLQEAFVKALRKNATVVVNKDIGAGPASDEPVEPFEG